MDLNYLHYFELVALLVSCEISSVSNRDYTEQNFSLGKKLAGFRRAMQTETVLLMLHKFSDQASINKITKNYSRIRDYHNDPPRYILTIQICNLVAEAINATRVSLTNYNITSYEENHLGKYPVITAYLLVKEMKLEYTKAKLGNLTSPLAQLFRPIGYNFAYCSITRKVDYNSMSLFLKIIGIADLVTWICIFVSVLGTAFIMKKGEHGTSKRSIILTIISALITPGISGNIRSTKCVPLVLWMFACIVLSTYYTGDLTSEVIKPREDARISKFAEFLRNNFSLLYNQKRFLVANKQLVANAPETRNETGNLGQKLLQLLGKPQISKSQEQFLQDFTFKDGAAAIQEWSTIITFASEGNQLIRMRKVQKRRCFVGEDIRFYSNYYFVFNGRLKQKTTKAFLFIVEAGIFQIWENEFVGLGVASRVQDRNRFVSPTRLQEDKQSVKYLEKDDKFLDLVWLWMIGLAIGFTCLIIEARTSRDGKIPKSHTPFAVPL